ncbi:general amino acid permease variant 1 [Mycena rosella]|uniref:General amino acid permease variant 1 n=1 Tax=Mycena rosella TaxID=1033263 RepID=A0AAD7GTH2_MYCRO|nr:general amino acid permease variant 1 [Mycena rosella]
MSSDPATEHESKASSVEEGSLHRENEFSVMGDKSQRRLSGPQIQMIAIAGTIGTGLFLAIGQVLAVTGPLGLLIAYLHVASVVYCTLTSIAEMTVFAPISGTFPYYAARWVDPALGFAVSWAYYYGSIMTLIAEITAACTLIGFWDPEESHKYVYITVLCVLTVTINLIGTRFFGRSEMFFSAIKIMLVLGFIIGGLVITLGGGPDHQRHGFEYWRNPGPMVSFLEPGAKGRFLGLLVAIVPAAFSMGGIELVAIAAAETRNPRRNLTGAMRTVVFRIVLFYILSVIILGMLVPSNDPILFQTASNAGQAPWVLAFKRAGVKGLPSLINAIIVTSAFSAGNSLLFAGSRILYGLALRKQAPSFFLRRTKAGLPLPAILFTSTFSLLAFLNVTERPSKVFSWFVTLSTISALLGWATMNLTYLRYYYGMQQQGIKPEGIYRSRFQPFGAMWALFWLVFYILISGIPVFWAFNGSDFVAAYINIPFFCVLYLGWKIVKKTKIVSLRDLDFTSGIPTLADTDDAVEMKTRSVTSNLLRRLF